MEYLILAQDDIKQMQELVNIYLQNGWELQGGLSVVVYKKHIGDSNLIQGVDVQSFMFSQAVIKKLATQN